MSQSFLYDSKSELCRYDCAELVRKRTEPKEPKAERAWGRGLPPPLPSHSRPMITEA